MQYDLEETIHDLWYVVQETIINTEAAKRQTGNIIQPTSLECRDMVSDEELLL